MTKAQSSSTAESRSILLTGGGGYVGTVLAPMLLEAGHKVKIIDQFYFGLEPLQAFRNHPGVTIIEEDILFQDNDPDLFEGIDTVIHLASISNDPSCDLDPNLTIRTNFLGTMALARRAKAEGVKQFIFASTCAVYGAADEQFLDESSQTGPVTLYALSKLESERELLKLNAPDFSITLLRFGTLFGLSPRMRFDLAINAMVKKALQNDVIIVNGLGKQYRPFLHVRDASRSLMAVMDAAPSVVSGETFNVGDERLNYQIDALAQTIASHFPGIKVEKILKNTDIRSYRPRFDKFKKALGMPLKYFIPEAVQEISDAYHAGTLGTMEEERFYTLNVLRKCHADPTPRSNLAVSTRWLSLVGQKN